jgi:hypothetical protein
MGTMSAESRSKFWAAMLSEEPDIGTGYINRHTFEVALRSSLRANYQLAGEDLWVDAAADRRKIEASPDDWVQIPKFIGAARDRYGDDNTGLEQFARDFFELYGLAVEVGS